MAIDEKKLIDAQEVINFIKHNWEVTDKDLYSHPKAVELGIGIAIRIIENTAILNGLSLEKFQATKTSDNDVPDTNVGKWIPCSKELPKEIGLYWVALPNEEYEVDWFFPDKQLWEVYRESVLAWKPIEPYKGEGL